MKRRHETEVPWGSFADALSGILFVFILTTFWFAWQLSQATAQMKQQVAAIRDADQRAFDLTRETGELAICLRQGDAVDPRQSPDEARLSLYLHGVEWFRSGKADLNDDPRRIVAANRIRTCIATLLEDPEVREHYRIRVYVEGHTDSVPFSGADQDTNWELSGRRAAAVVRFVLDGSEGDIVDAMAVDDLEVIAAGMAERRPAWSRLCEPPRAGEAELMTASDHEVCTALQAWAAERRPGARTPQDGRAEQQLLATLRDPAHHGQDESCSPVDPRELEQVSLGDLLRRWANRCPDPTLDRGEGRRGLLRRVDLRLELLPKTPAEVAP